MKSKEGAREEGSPEDAQVHRQSEEDPVLNEPVLDPELPPRETKTTLAAVPAAEETGENMQQYHQQMQPSPQTTATYTSREHEAFAVRHRRWHDAPAELSLPADVRWWTTDHVARWATHLGFTRYADELRRHNVSGEVLLVADAAVLKEADIKPIGDRIMLLRARDLLMASSSMPFEPVHPYHQLPSSRYAVVQRLQPPPSHHLNINGYYFPNDHRHASDYVMRGVQQHPPPQPVPDA